MGLNSNTLHISRRQSARHFYIFLQYSFGIRSLILKIKKFPIPDNIITSLRKESRNKRYFCFHKYRDWKHTSSYDLLKECNRLKKISFVKWSWQCCKEAKFKQPLSLPHYLFLLFFRSTPSSFISFWNTEAPLSCI